MAVSNRSARHGRPGMFGIFDRKPERDSTRGRLFVGGCGLVLIMAAGLVVGCGGGEEAASTSGDQNAYDDPGAASATTTPASSGGTSGGSSGGSDPAMAMAGGPGDSGGGDAAAMPEGYDPAMPEGYDPAMIDGYGGTSGGAGGNRQPKMSDRPDDFKQWTAEHFAKAVEERDPRLVEAVNAIAESSQGDPKVAAQLTALLELVAKMPEAPVVVQPRNPGATSSGYPAGSFLPGPGLPGSDPAAFPSSDPASIPTGNPAPVPGGPGAPLEQPQGALDTETVPVAGGNAIFTRPVLLASLLVGYQPPAGTSQDFSQSADPAGAGYQPPADAAAMPEGYSIPMPGGAPYGAGGGNRPVASGIDKDALIRAILRGLATNGTAEAWQTLEQLLKGELSIGLSDADAVDFVLALLIENYGGKEHPTHQLLNRVLNEPEVLRAQEAAGKDQLSAGALQQRAIQLHARFAASAMDVLLGVSAIGSKSPAPSPVIASARSRQPSQTSGGSQFLGGAYATPEAGDPAAIAQDDTAGLSLTGPAEGYPGAPADAAFPGGATSGGTFPGGTPPGGPGFPGGPGPDVPVPDIGPPGAPGQFQPVGANVSVSLDAEELKRVVAYLWQSELLQTVADRTRSIDKLGRNVDMLTLAASLPATTIRSAVYELLHGHWQDGAGGLSSQGFFEREAHDPGLHVIVKTLPRERPRASRSRTVRRDEHADAKASWLKASEQMLRTLNTRMYAAGRKADTANAAATRAFPVNLHTGAQVLVDYRLNWPDDARPQTGSVAPEAMQVRYIRIEQNGNATVVSRHYERELVGAQRHILPNVTWFDRLGPGGLPGSTRSLDVVVNNVGSRKYLVQILEIVIPDPNPNPKTE